MDELTYTLFETTTGEETKFTDPYQAGEAFYNADRGTRPVVTEENDNNQGRIIAATTIMGSVAEEYQIGHSLPDPESSNQLQLFHSGFHAALQKGVESDLKKKDWSQFHDDQASRTMIDLKRLAKHDPEAARRLWNDIAPENTPAPAFLNTKNQDQKEEYTNSIELDSRKVQAEKSKEVKTEQPKPAQQQEQEIETFEALPETYTKANLPDHLKKKYIQVGNKFFYNNAPDKAAFVDHGNKIKTKSNSTSIAESMLELAKSRGWSQIKVKGSEEFRRNVWLMANLQGITVNGYKPTDVDLAVLEKRLQTPGEQAIDAFGTTGPAKTDRLSGTLIDHGSAPFENKKGNTQSYFVTLANADGKENTVWGKDLQRAIKEQGAAKGDEITLEHLGKQPVTIDKPIKNEQGEVVGHEKIDTHRNTWEVKADALKQKKPEEIIKEHPDMAQEAATLKLAEKVAKRFPNKADRQRFMNKVENRLSDQVRQAQPATEIKIREVQQQQRKTAQDLTQQR